MAKVMATFTVLDLDSWKIVYDPLQMHGALLAGKVRRFIRMNKIQTN
jgi:hypothetical protein